MYEKLKKHKIYKNLRKKTEKTRNPLRKIHLTRSPLRVSPKTAETAQPLHEVIQSRHDEYLYRGSLNFQQGVPRVVENNQHLFGAPVPNVHETYQGRQQTDSQQLSPNRPGTGNQDIFIPPMNLFVNCFPTKLFASWCLFYYNMDIDPRVTSSMDIFSSYQDRMDGFIFNGFVYFTHVNYYPENDNSSSTRHRAAVLSVKFTYDVDNNYEKDQVFILVLNQCLAHLNLKLTGRYFYYPIMENTMTVDFDVCLVRQSTKKSDGTLAAKMNDKRSKSSRHNNNSSNTNYSAT